MSTLKERMIGSFISHGPQVEHEGQMVSPEVHVSIAVGTVEKVTPSGKNGEMLRVEMGVQGAQFGYNGYISNNDIVASLIKQAKENGTPICLRFEKKRKKVDTDKNPISPLTPIEEISSTLDIARKNIVKIVSGAYNINDKKWILSEEAQSNPADDPGYIESKILASVNQDVNSFFATPAPKLQGQADDKANHLISMYYYVMEIEKANNFTLNEKQRRYLAEKLLGACDILQVAVYNAETVNYRDYSHSKARFMLFKWIEQNPLLKETLSELDAHLDKFVKENTVIWKWAISKSVSEETSNE